MSTDTHMRQFDVVQPVRRHRCYFFAWLRSALFGVFSSVWFFESPSADKWTFGILKKYYIPWMTQVLQMCNRRKILFLCPGLHAILPLEQVWLQKVKAQQQELIVSPDTLIQTAGLWQGCCAEWCQDALTKYEKQDCVTTNWHYTQLERRPH